MQEHVKNSKKIMVAGSLYILVIRREEETHHCYTIDIAEGNRGYCGKVLRSWSSVEAAGSSIALLMRWLVLILVD